MYSQDMAKMLFDNMLKAVDEYVGYISSTRGDKDSQHNSVILLTSLGDTETEGAKLGLMMGGDNHTLIHLVHSIMSKKDTSALREVFRDAAILGIVETQRSHGRRRDGDAILKDLFGKSEENDAQENTNPEDGQ